MFCKNCGEKAEENINLCSECQSINKSESESGKGLFHILFKGRIGRLRYFLYSVYVGVISMIVFKILGITTNFPWTESASNIFGISNFLAIAYIPITAKRLRDISWPGYTAIIFYVLGLFFGLNLAWIIISLIWGFVLLFKKGDVGENQYGYPKTDGRNMKWISYSLLALFVFAMIILTVAPLIFQ